MPNNRILIRIKLYSERPVHNVNYIILDERIPDSIMTQRCHRAIIYIIASDNRVRRSNELNCVSMQIIITMLRYVYKSIYSEC